MKRIIHIITTLSILGLLALLTPAAYADSASLTVNAEVIASASVAQTTALDFGQFALTDSSSAGTRYSPSAGTDSNIDSFSSGTTGVVTISGKANTAINISITNATLSETGGDTMTATLSVPAASVTTDGSGSATSDIEGYLTVSAGQTAGTYTGTATVSVNY